MNTDRRDTCELQTAYETKRRAHTEAWLRANEEDFCVRKQLDPDKGGHLPGAYIHEET